MALPCLPSACSETATAQLLQLRKSFARGAPRLSEEKLQCRGGLDLDLLYPSQFSELALQLSFRFPSRTTFYRPAVFVDFFEEKEITFAAILLIV